MIIKKKRKILSYHILVHTYINTPTINFFTFNCCEIKILTTMLYKKLLLNAVFFMSAGGRSLQMCMLSCEK